MFDRENAPQEAKELYDGIALIVKMTRWAFECALKEGFTEDQALKIGMDYMKTAVNAGYNNAKR